MKKDRLVGIILVTIGALFLIGGAIVTVKELTKEEEPPKQQEEPTNSTIINGIEYKKYNLTEKNEKVQFQVTVQNTYVTASTSHYVTITFYDSKKKVLETLDCLIPALDISQTMHLEFEYPGETIPKEYTIFIEPATHTAEVG